MQTKEELRRTILSEFGDYRIYPESIYRAGGCVLFLAKDEGQKLLIVVEEEAGSAFDRFVGPQVYHPSGKRVKEAPLQPVNAAIVRELLPFTAPVALGATGMSLGLGDRLGIASPGHLRLIKKTGVRPVLAQQSVRELTLTNRTYTDVLDAATWAVLQEGYESGFGADGDHLKTAEEIRGALDLGFTMITLDASAHIDNTVGQKSAKQVADLYHTLPADYTADMEEYYLGKAFIIGGMAITFDTETLQRLVLTYGKALAFMGYIYHTLIANAGRAVDFEISIDETATPTTPAAHYFVASELGRMGVKFTSLAPRFCGEFQKGIDYIGDLHQFAEEFKSHAAIADHFGYRLSIHSGSDKFSVFPVIGRYTRGRVHVKTAGTNWLEALRVVARINPALFREIYAFAREVFDEAKKYYHVTTDLTRLPDVAAMADDVLPTVLDHNDARQVLHITYGLVLTAANADGSYRFKDDLYELWFDHEDEYYAALENHIGRHLAKLTENLKD
ncbi:tagaturonate epimerase family protein [Sporolituus thermophilus]|uniref:Tagaturonate/fructuronate epimerase n=1 Tax=Sporolituus thermophilus DSM 23256 TaxID=1123285 RepID=A0A1G7P8F4_9FIRM|nr:tagaturonate epimerase family protein [Sporolituus thermophilus]SDF82427.1 tagaturonate epimerase [Sporolituus thermophilus DSM 23256]